MNYGSHGSGSVGVYLKVLPDRLDGTVSKVGARYRKTTVDIGYTHKVEVSEWIDIVAFPFFGSNDYFPFQFSVGSNYYHVSHEVAFYVLSSRGTTYWLQPEAFSNYAIDRDLFRFIQWKANYKSDTHVGTQFHDRLKAYNPANCH